MAQTGSSQVTNMIGFQHETRRRASCPQSRGPQKDEQELLRLLRESNWTRREIAQKLDRSEAAISVRLTIIRKRTVNEALADAIRFRPSKTRAFSDQLCPPPGSEEVGRRH